MWSQEETHQYWLYSTENEKHRDNRFRISEEKYEIENIPEKQWKNTKIYKTESEQSQPDKCTNNLGSYIQTIDMKSNNSLRGV